MTTATELTDQDRAAAREAWDVAGAEFHFLPCDTMPGMMLRTVYAVYLAGKRAGASEQRGNVPRIPSDEMQQAGIDSGAFDNGEFHPYKDLALTAWIAMYDAAIRSQPTARKEEK